MQPKTTGKLSDSVRAYYDKLFQDGFLVSVHISKWGMCTNLNKEDLDYEGVVPSIFKLGKKMLINPAKFNEFVRIEGKARRYLSANSYDFPIGDAHFVPKKKVGEVLASLGRFKEQFNVLKERFIANYEEYKKEVLAKYPDMADTLTPLYPPQEKLDGKFGFSVSLYEIQMPRELGEVDIQTLMTRERAKDEIKEELEAQLAEHHNQSIQKLESFAEQAAKVLRTQIINMCNSVISKIQTKEVVSPTTVQSIREEIDNFKKLNFLDDKAVEVELDKLAKVVEVNVNYRTDKEALVDLNDALTQVLTKANNLADITEISDVYFRRAIKL